MIPVHSARQPGTSSPRPAGPAPDVSPPHEVPAGLQRAIGNQALGRMLEPGSLPGSSPSAAPSQNDRVGQPLDSSVRTKLDSALGFDLSRVRVHTDETAANSAAAIGASAYTKGNDIVFGAGRYRPESPEGRRLLAHEAFHVAHQQSSTGLRSGIAPPESLSERAASQFAGAFAKGEGSRGEFATPGARNSAGPAWEINREQIITKGTEVHHGDVGAVPIGPPIGGVSVRTGEEIEIPGGTRIPNVIALEYSGSLSAQSRWLQFVWFELVASTPAGPAAVAGSIPTSSGTLPFTTNAAAPNWSVDSGPTDPFYESGAVNLRTTSSTTIFDAPGGSSVSPLAAGVFRALPTATSVTFRAHFQTYLIQRDVAAYVVGYTASTAFTKVGGVVTAAAIGYTVAGSGPVTSVPTNLKTILVANYPTAKVT